MVGKFVNALRGARRRTAVAAGASAPIERRDLPADVESAIRGCTFIARAPRDDGAPRILVQLASRHGGWIHNTEASRAAIAARWPDLSERQLARALRFLESEIAMQFRGSMSRRKRTSFVNSWREDDTYA
ncbi:MAG: hypothetical protein ACJ8IK_00335 [Burkholderiaceae bacterium]